MQLKILSFMLWCTLFQNWGCKTRFSNAAFKLVLQLSQLGCLSSQVLDFGVILVPFLAVIRKLHINSTAFCDTMLASFTQNIFYSY